MIVRDYTAEILSSGASTTQGEKIQCGVSRALGPGDVVTSLPLPDKFQELSCTFEPAGDSVYTRFMRRISSRRLSWMDVRGRGTRAAAAEGSRKGICPRGLPVIQIALGQFAAAAHEQQIPGPIPR